MTLEEYCRDLAWNAAELARQASIDVKTVRKALDGEEISSKSARAIAGALSTATGQQVSVGMIDGLNYK